MIFTFKKIICNQKNINTISNEFCSKCDYKILEVPQIQSRREVDRSELVLSLFNEILFLQTDSKILICHFTILISIFQLPDVNVPGNVREPSDVRTIFGNLYTHIIPTFPTPHPNSPPPLPFTPNSQLHNHSTPYHPSETWNFNIVFLQKRINSLKFYVFIHYLHISCVTSRITAFDFHLNYCIFSAQINDDCTNVCLNINSHLKKSKSNNEIETIKSYRWKHKSCTVGYLYAMYWLILYRKCLFPEFEMFVHKEN